MPCPAGRTPRATPASDSPYDPAGPSARRRPHKETAPVTIIRRIDVLSSAKVYSALMTVVGLIAGAFVSLFAILGASMAAGMGDEPGAGLLGVIFGIGAIIVLPIVYGVMGFIVGAIQAFVYNVVASRIGGIQIELG